MITDLAHIAFAAHDLESTLAFYRLLGIHETFRLNHSDGSLMLVYLHVAGNRFIKVFPGGPPPDAEDKVSFMHLCLLTDDLHALVDRLQAAGMVLEQSPSVGLDHNWQAWIRDPDGNALELMQLTEDSPQRQMIRQAAK